MFGDVDPDARDVEFKFGFEGKPPYVAGPTESPSQIRRRLDLLMRRLGPDGFEFQSPEEALDALDDLDDDG